MQRQPRYQPSTLMLNGDIAAPHARILYIVDSIKRGGMERRMLELLKGISAYNQVKVQIMVLSPSIGYPDFFDLGYKIHIEKRTLKKDPKIFLKFYKLCKSFKPDIVHSWGTMSAIYAIPAVKLLKIPLINANIRDATDWKNPFNSKLLRAKFSFLFSDVILSNSMAGLKSFGVSGKKGFCIRNGIDINRAKNLVSSDEIRHTHKIKTPKVVGMVGGFNNRKDFQTYVKAAEMILEKYDDVTFMAIGGGPHLEPTKAMVADKFKERILFPGQLKDVESVINIFDVGVLATNSDKHGEGISNSIMEYMLLGKPVVATNGGGTPEIVDDVKTGFLVAPRDPYQLMGKIELLLNDPDLAQFMGAKGQEKILREFTLEIMKQNYFKLYKSILN